MCLFEVYNFGLKESIATVVKFKHITKPSLLNFLGRYASTADLDNLNVIINYISIRMANMSHTTTHALVEAGAVPFLIIRKIVVGILSSAVVLNRAAEIEQAAYKLCVGAPFQIVDYLRIFQSFLTKPHHLRCTYTEQLWQLSTHSKDSKQLWAKINATNIASNDAGSTHTKANATRNARPGHKRVRSELKY